MAIHRRDFLRLAGSGLALGTVAPLFRCQFMSRPLRAAMMGSAGDGKKLLLCFLRGGNDGLATVIPAGDPEYNTINRPTLFIPEEDSIDTGNGFARLHPGLLKLTEVPNVAYLHRVGMVQGESQSHFEDELARERAEPPYEVSEQGWVNSLVSEALSNIGFPAASVSYNLQAAFQGSPSLAHINVPLSEYNLGTLGGSTATYNTKLLGAAPAGTSYGSGLIGVYNQPAHSTAHDSAVRATGRVLTSSLGQIADATFGTPAGGATYPNASAPGDFPNNYGAWSFFGDVRTAVDLLKNTECCIAGVQLGGFDTHVNQEMGGYQKGLLEQVAHAIRSVYLDTSATIWNNLVVVVMSEFGRTSAENGSFGTDHAQASCMIVAGGNVIGGVYNCDSATWAAGDMFSSYGRYVSLLTEHRTVLAEICDRHFNASPGAVIPDWDQLSNDGPEFSYLNFLPAP